MTELMGITKEDEVIVEQMKNSALNNQSPALR